MDRELVETYKNELALLYEYAAAFAEEYPGIADRLGGLARERADPMVTGLLEGTAFLAARVQLKLKHEFSEFTFNLIDQLLPGYLAPVPSIMLAQVKPTFGDPALRSGRTIARGSALDAAYRDKDYNVACTFTTCGDVTYWPFEIARAEYLPSIGPLQALGLNTMPETAAGLRLTLSLRTAAKPEDEPSDETIPADPAARIAGCSLDGLPVHLLGAESDAVLLYEQLFSHLASVHIRHLDEFGDPQFIALPKDCITQVGFGEDDSIMPDEARLFRGFRLLQEYFIFPRKFLGFTIGGLRRAIQGVQNRTMDIILTFNQSVPRLAAAVDAPMFGLYATPAVNLFPKLCDRIQLSTSRHEHQVVPDRTQYLNFEPNRILDVHLHVAGRREKQRVHPIYRSTLETVEGGRTVFYSLRRRSRKRSSDEQRFGVASDYVGTDMFVSISPSDAGAGGAQSAPELSIRALCSNRHLAEQLPIGRGATDFRLRDDTQINIVAAVAPTKPQESVAAWKHSTPHHEVMGRVAWRLVNMLSLNHLGLSETDGRAIRELMALFADLSDPVVERRVRGLRAVKSHDVVRRFAQRAGVGAARGVEIELTFDDKAFEGSGVYLLGAVLDRFFAEYVALNHFTQTVVRTSERGVIARWAPRSGTRTSF
jgi:type VI secretion system protein ImpG